MEEFRRYEREARENKKGFVEMRLHYSYGKAFPIGGSNDAGQ